MYVHFRAMSSPRAVLGIVIGEAGLPAMGTACWSPAQIADGQAESPSTVKSIPRIKKSSAFRRCALSTCRPNFLYDIIRKQTGEEVERRWISSRQTILSRAKQSDVYDCAWCRNYVKEVEKAYPCMTAYLQTLDVPDIAKPFETMPLEVG